MLLKEPQAGFVWIAISATRKGLNNVQRCSCINKKEGKKAVIKGIAVPD
jgi:hypothetical protein